MLNVTPAASAAIADILRSPDVPDGTAIRVTRGHDAAGDLQIGLALVDGPDTTDEVIETVAGVAVFVEREAVPLLADQELDAEIGPDREQVAFVFQRQRLNGGPPEPLA